MTEGPRRAVPHEHDASGGNEHSAPDVQPQGPHDTRVDAPGDAQTVPAIVEAREVHKRFAVTSWVPGRPKATVEALRGASLVVGGGSIHGVMGPNGSGKSTLLRVLSTLVIADSGVAEV